VGSRAHEIKLPHTLHTYQNTSKVGDEEEGKRNDY
jgi:hypothetical protein